jgi:hypothetical protein
MSQLLGSFWIDKKNNWIYVSRIIWKYFCSDSKIWHGTEVMTIYEQIKKAISVEVVIQYRKAVAKEIWTFFSGKK